MKKLLLTAFFAMVTIAVSAQYGYRDANRIGITVGINQFNLNTSNFATKAGTGWNAGLSIRGNFYNDFDAVYSIQFSENRFSVPTTNALLQKEEVEYKLPSAQISFLWSYKIVENHLSVELGPLLQINDKFNIDDDANKANIIDGVHPTADGTPLNAGDIMKISRFNIYPVVGITTGVRHFRLNLQYQYDVTNMLGGLNGQELGINFKGHPGIISGNLIIYL